LSGCTTYGIVLATGPLHAASEAAAVVKPTYLRNSLLLVDEVPSASSFPINSAVGISSTNSFCLSVSAIELLGFSSSTLDQYFLFDAMLYITILNRSFIQTYLDS